MSVIKLFCMDCKNDGRDHKNDEPFGFKIMAPFLTMVEMSSVNPSEANFFGNQAHGNTPQAVIDSYSRKDIECIVCGSKNVQLICEADMYEERKEARAVESIDLGEELGVRHVEGHIPTINTGFDRADIHTADEFTVKIDFGDK